MSAPTDGPRPPLDPERPSADRFLTGFELPPTGTGVRAARRAAQAAQAAAAQAAAAQAGGADAPPVPVEQAPAGPSRRFMVGFTAAMAACVVAAVVLAGVGLVTLRDSRAGRTLTSAAPDEPGFEGVLEPTPTLAVAHERDGALLSVALLALGSGDNGGSVVLVPIGTLVGEASNAATLAVGHVFGGGIEQTRQGLEVITGVGVDAAVAVDDARLAALVDPLGELTLENPDELDGFPRGTLHLAPEDVGSYLAAGVDDGNDLARLARHQVFWRAWIAAVAAAPEALPGERDAGLGRFLSGLAAGPVQIATAPVQVPDDATPGLPFVVDRDAMAAAIIHYVPFPLSTQFAPRTTVRLLDGTGEAAHVARIAPSVVAATASIVVVGNASSFDHRTTEIRYHAPGGRSAAERLQRALGAGVVVEDVRPIDSFDVTIVLGTDL